MKNNLKWLSQTFKFYMRVDNFLFDTVHTLMQGGGGGCLSNPFLDGERKLKKKKTK
jgi:hypothetical protein